jgi:hypothetical protein
VIRHSISYIIRRLFFRQGGGRLPHHANISPITTHPGRLGYAFLTLFDDTVFSRNDGTYSSQNPRWEGNWLGQCVGWEKSLKWGGLLSGILPRFVLIYFRYPRTVVFTSSKTHLRELRLNAGLFLHPYSIVYWLQSGFIELSHRQAFVQ